MKRVALIVLLAGGVATAQEAPTSRFATVDVYIDSREPVAAWQFELRERNGSMQVVGVESGEHAAFGEAPYYDREAVNLGTADRIVVAAYSLADAAALPAGRFRAATVHVLLSGDAAPDYELELITATGPDGRVLDARASVVEATGRNP